MKIEGEIEAAICEGIGRFEREYGSRPEHPRLPARRFRRLRLQGLLTPAEQQRAKFPSEKGRDLFKQVRGHLIETAKPFLQAMVKEITGVELVRLHHYISTVTGEAFVVLTLAGAIPRCREAKH